MFDEESRIDGVIGWEVVGRSASQYAGEMILRYVQNDKATGEADNGQEGWG